MLSDEGDELSGPSPPSKKNVLQLQLEELRTRLVAAANGAYKKEWFDDNGAIKSGTVMMKAIWTDSELNDGLGDIL